jgi:hypothetical protein
MAIRARSLHGRFLRKLPRLFDSSSRIDVLDREFQQARESMKIDVQNLVKSTEMVVTALKPIELALKTLAHRLAQLENNVSDSIQRHSVRDDHSALTLATQRERSEEVDARLSALAEQVAWLKTSIEETSLRVADVSMLLGSRNEACLEGTNSINMKTTVEPDLPHRLNFSEPRGEVTVKDPEAMLAELDAQFANRITEFRVALSDLISRRKTFAASPNGDPNNE